MDYISKGETIDTFDEGMRLNPGSNGEEYRLFGGILELIQSSYLHEGVFPWCFGETRLGERFSGISPYLAKEHSEIPGFPDCIYVNEGYVLCIDHAQINASEPRSQYKNGDEYRAFLSKHAYALEQNHYDELERLIGERGILFTPQNLVQSLLYALNSKLPKIGCYKKSVTCYISSGAHDDVIAEDLGKCMEVWLLIEGVTPTTSFEVLFSHARILSFLAECPELEGLIYCHHPFLTQSPQDIGDIAFIHNDSHARTQLALLAASLRDSATSN